MQETVKWWHSIHVTLVSLQFPLNLNNFLFNLRCSIVTLSQYEEWYFGFLVTLIKFIHYQTFLTPQAKQDINHEAVGHTGGLKRNH